MAAEPPLGIKLNALAKRVVDIQFPITFVPTGLLSLRPRVDFVTLRGELVSNPKKRIHLAAVEVDEWKFCIDVETNGMERGIPRPTSDMGTIVAYSHGKRCEFHTINVKIDPRAVFLKWIADVILPLRG